MSIPVQTMVENIFLSKLCRIFAREFVVNHKKIVYLENFCYEVGVKSFGGGGIHRKHIHIVLLESLDFRRKYYDMYMYTYLFLCSISKFFPIITCSVTRLRQPF